MANFEEDVFKHKLTYQAVTEMFKETPSAQVSALQLVWLSPLSALHHNTEDVGFSGDVSRAAWTSCSAII